MDFCQIGFLDKKSKLSNLGFNPFSVEDYTVIEDRPFSSLGELASIARNSAYSSNIVEYP
ncbi:MAG: hypothetical protein U9O53_03655 [archaeon]|nr:hypothetical protein [archaeon]